MIQMSNVLCMQWKDCLIADRHNMESKRTFWRGWYLRWKNANGETRKRGEKEAIIDDWRILENKEKRKFSWTFEKWFGSSQRIHLYLRSFFQLIQNISVNISMGNVQCALFQASYNVITEWRRNNATQQTRNQIFI